MVSSKLVGLTILRKTIQKNRIQAKVLPYIVIRKPESFSMKLLPSGTKRVLVRTDLGGKKGVLSNEIWGDLPRKIFNARSV